MTTADLPERPRGIFAQKKEGFHSKSAACKRESETAGASNTYQTAPKRAVSGTKRTVIEVFDSDSDESSLPSSYHSTKSQVQDVTDLRQNDKSTFDKDSAQSKPKVQAILDTRVAQMLQKAPKVAANLDAAHPETRILPWVTSSAQVKRNRVPTAELVTTPAGAASKGGTAATVNTVLSGPQQEILRLVLEKGESVFFTGSAGTGKSYLLREIIKSLREKYGESKVAVTASTGMAACNIGGTTLHSFAGIGLGNGDPAQLVKSICTSKRNGAQGRWLRTSVLIIDEVSMVDGLLFDKLEYVARMVRKNQKPFGNMQLVVTGDFFQLPPVGTDKFCFLAKTWSSTMKHTIALKDVFRQTDDTFVNMLNEMRLGKLTGPTLLGFSRLSRRLQFDDGIDPTELFATRNEVHTANETRLALINEPAFPYIAQDHGSNPEQVQRLLEPCIAPPTLSLKKGAQVMLIKNIDETLVNGSQGKVLDFITSTEYAKREPESGINQEILALLSSAAAAAVEKAKRVSEFGKREGDKPASGHEPKYPLVSFIQPNGPPREYLCTPKDWTIEDPNNPPKILATRIQVPLVLSWAMSIHKSQGQTLNRVKVDLGRVFEKGQAYVALSRATSLEGLQVLNFRPVKVMAHPIVIEWNRQLMGLDKLAS